MTDANSPGQQKGLQWRMRGSRRTALQNHCHVLAAAVVGVEADSSTLRFAEALRVAVCSETLEASQLEGGVRD